MTIEPITLERYKNKRFISVAGYQFAKQYTTASVVLHELRKVAMCLPFGFTQLNGQFMSTAILGLQTSKNLMIDFEGKWLVDYIPAAIRAYPFSLAPHPENGKLLLSVDTDSPNFSDTHGEFLFDDAGKPTPFVTRILNFLTHVSENHLLTLRLCAQLDQYGLIIPWDIAHTIGTSVAKNEVRVQGFFRIDEDALNALSDQQFEKLRSSGCLPLVYSQLLSIEHLSKMWQRLSARQKEEQASQVAKSNISLESSMIGDQTMLSFESLFSQKED